MFFFTDLHLGGWWGAILTVISGSLALSSANRGVVTGVCITGSIGIVIAIIAAIVDGISSDVFKSFTGCCNGERSCWGTTEGQNYSLLCMASNYAGSSGSECYCTDAGNDGGSYSCWHYELSSGTDCNEVLTTYASELSASTAFLSFGAITLLILSVTTCAALCCAKPTTTVVQTTPNPAAPVVIVSPIAATPAVPYSPQQPQVAYMVDGNKY